MVNYQQSIIYKLCCKDPEITDIYIGSTTNFSRRKNEHKSVCYNQDDRHYNQYVYSFIRDHSGWDNFDMVLIEKYSCNSKMELHSRERYWIEELNATLNNYIPTRSKKEYYETNKELLNEKKKEYYENNREYFSEYFRRHREQNKEQIAGYLKDWYERNKEKVSEKAKAQYLCEVCKFKLRKDGKIRHEKTQKHQDNLSKPVIIFEDSSDEE